MTRSSVGSIIAARLRLVRPSSIADAGESDDQSWEWVAYNPTSETHLFIFCAPVSHGRELIEADVRRRLPCHISRRAIIVESDPIEALETEEIRQRRSRSPNQATNSSPSGVRSRGTDSYNDPFCDRLYITTLVTIT